MHRNSNIEEQLKYGKDIEKVAYEESIELFWSISG